MKNYSNFNNYPKVSHKGIIPFYSSVDKIDFNNCEGYVLPYGLGKSYGDVCLNPDNYLIDCSFMNKFISFSEETGVLEAESGVTLNDILQIFVPKGYFLPVTPGTKFITLGGAIANDVHGKNHHKLGSFGNHILEIEILKTDGQKILCSKEFNYDLFKSTIGGLGLTGIITKAKLKLFKIGSVFLNTEYIKFNSFEEFFEINSYSEQEYEYTVAWVNASQIGKGIYIRGNFLNENENNEIKLYLKKKLNIPINLPLINSISINIFNFLNQNKQLKKISKKINYFDKFFYPLDNIYNWNRLYGKNGFLQYQFVIPLENSLSKIKEIFKIIKENNLKSFLSVLKTFGNIKSVGILSFPIQGLTLAIDFKISNYKLFETLDILDKIVLEAGGRIYPAKDCRMKGEVFFSSYNIDQNFLNNIDIKISSGFWRRINNT